MCTYPKYIAYNDSGLRIIRRSPFKLPDDEGLQYSVVPCGCCEDCIKAKKLDLTNKILFYEKTHDIKYMYFITLTISDNFITDFDKYCTKVDYLQKFIKRLRRTRGSVGDKYVLIEEFGKAHDRRHFHMLLFTEFEVLVSQVRSCWDYGFINIQNLSNQANKQSSIYYCLKYISKDSNPFYLVSKGFNYPDRYSYVPFTGIKLNTTLKGSGQTLEQLKQYYEDNKRR